MQLSGENNAERIFTPTGEIGLSSRVLSDVVCFLRVFGCVGSRYAQKCGAVFSARWRKTRLLLMNTADSLTPQTGWLAGCGCAGKEIGVDLPHNCTRTNNTQKADDDDNDRNEPEQNPVRVFELQAATLQVCMLFAFIHSRTNRSHN